MDQDEDLDSVPLVEKTASTVDDDDVPGDGEDASRWDLLILTAPFFGLQLTWTVQQVFGVPYLASLGISNTQMPLFVASGPVAGLLGPPVIAALSDACQRPWGKRKPFILLGGLGAILSFLVLATAQPLAETFVRSTSAARTTSHVIAGLSINSLNFSIQSLQMGLRASVVDQVAPHQQATANLWISRFSSLGSVFVALVGLGYSPAFFDLSVVVVSVLALLLGLVACTNIPNTAVSHLQPGFGRDAEKVTISGLVAHFSRVLRRARHLPPVTRRTCRVQLVSWFAWFLVLNYTSALINRVNDNSPRNTGSKPSAEASDAVSRVALLFHTASLATLVVASLVWRRSGAKLAAVDADDLSDNEKVGINSHDRSLAHTRNILIRQVWKPSLAALAVSLVATCLLVLSTTPAAAAATTMISLLLGANGMLFALANWVPYALIADEASALARAKAMLAAEGEGGGEEEEGDDTPKLLAVHNMSITAPQIVASAASWVLMQGLAIMGLEQRAVWLFVMCIPAAIWAACL